MQVFREQSVHLLYDFYYPHKLDWPASCCEWGRVLEDSEGFQTHEVFFGTRSDGRFNEKTKSWNGCSSLIVQGDITIPKDGYQLVE